MGIENQKLDSQQANPGENMGIKKGIGETLDEKQILLRMIGKIENEEVKSVLSSYVSKGRRPLVILKKELEVYNDLLKNYSREQVSELNDFISKYNILPSDGVKEISMKDKILSEENPNVRELMEISLTKSKIKPSVILQGRVFYEIFITDENLVTDESQEEKDLIIRQEKKGLIVRYLEEGYTPKSVNDEYESFVKIMSYEYKDENLKNFILSLIKEEQVTPSLIELYFDLFKDREYSNETENYMRGLLNQPKK